MVDTSTASSGAPVSDAKGLADLVKRVDAIAEARGWSKAEISRRSGVAQGTLSQWMSGKYAGNYDAVSSKIRNWLDQADAVEELAASVPVSPDFLELNFAQSVLSTLSIAQVMPAMVMITADAGMGKTVAARRYAATRPNSYLVTMSPHTRSIHNMLTEIAAGLSVEERSAGKLVRAIGKRIERVGDGTLLIVDEAQNLSDDAINQLRHFVDNFGCGVALVGNRETYARFTSWGQGDRYGQLRRRVFRRIRRDKPSKEDLLTFLTAWGVSDPKQVEFLTGVGLKPGALGQIDMTIKLARLTAEGRQREVTLADLKSAWANRDVESV
ncbi:AAA family ATPase [uncultured Maricaulis sp.]|uniref:AAA family ATPase n=1 Tax=uncultured Maricaulis sp. TaxID=174710 RepID=UPI0030D98A73|tara:strand:- start:148484 stop:149461 length:978 start_codon:yes stop_codon:yes gene_type:complete